MDVPLYKLIFICIKYLPVSQGQIQQFLECPVVGVIFSDYICQHFFRPLKKSENFWKLEGTAHIHLECK